VEFTGNGAANKGKGPFGELVIGSDGNFYGTTETGGASDNGTVFQMTPAGALATLVEFTGNGATNKGANSQAGLTRASDGSFYGTTNAGGASNLGTIFTMTPAGALTTLVEFTGNGATNKGANPQAALVRGPDGSFYGTTYNGGLNNAGTLFRMTPAGVLTTLVNFALWPSTLGAHPRGTLIRGTDNNLYGTTEDGGASNGGTVFRLRFYPHDFNGDNTADLVWRHDSGAIYAWFMDGLNLLGGSFFNPGQVDPSWKISGVGDFNQDGRPDLIWRHEGGSLAVWFMDGINLLSSAVFSSSPVDPVWKISGVGDFNYDGKPDLLWRHDNGTLAVWFMDGINLQSSTLLNPSSVDPAWTISGVGDFNQDGKPDLIWRHESGTLAVWFMTGINLQSSALFNPGSVDPIWTISGVGDFNQDGKPDFVWRHDDGAIYAWFMDGINLLSGAYFNPNQTDPAWKIRSP
jgi:uncharacterized repeat protein (TIGR03803 family)